MDPIQIAQLVATSISSLIQIYKSLEQSQADKIKPLVDIIAAANAIDDAGIAAAEAEIAKLTGQPTPPAV